MEPFIVATFGLLLVGACATLAPRLRLAAPILLVLTGIGIGLLPWVPAVEVDPELILAGILPPLLYAASVSMPTMGFRRDFAAISGLSVVLVIVSSFVMGFFFSWVIPGLSFWWGVALGAIVSPTDAVAVSIVRKVGVGGRSIAVLQGESLLNDATALVMLRTAIGATATAVGFWGIAGSLAYSVVVATVIGVAVGYLNLWIRSKVSDASVNTVFSLCAPFVASIPAELLGASGLVAAVVAGLVTGHEAARLLPPQHRLSDEQVWRTIELVLEGAIFLLMGLELFGIIEEVLDEHGDISVAMVAAAVGLVLILVIRSAYTVLLLARVGWRTRRRENSQARLPQLQARFASAVDERRGWGFKRMSSRMRRFSADIDYLQSAPLGWREGGVLIWAGMRGAVTLAAAQTLPEETPYRPLLILTAFTLATASLVLQGTTLGAVVKWLKPAGPDVQLLAAEHKLLDERLEIVEAEVRANEPSTVSPQRLRIAIIEAQRDAVLDVRDYGEASSEVLEGALARLDAEQISVELKASADEQA